MPLMPHQIMPGQQQQVANLPNYQPQMPMSALENALRAGAGDQGAEGIGQGFQGIGQGGIGGLIAQLMGATEGMNRFGQGGMDPNAMTQAAAMPSMTSAVTDATGLGRR